MTKSKGNWQPFMVYLDPHDPDDREIINYLKPHKRRRNISSEIRRALIVYMAYLKRRKKPETDDPIDMGDDWGTPRQEQPRTVIEVSPTVNEAAHTFIKSRR